jgi:hypothetical protein
MDVTLLIALAAVVLLFILSIALFFRKTEKPKQGKYPFVSTYVRFFLKC